MTATIHIGVNPNSPGQALAKRGRDDRSQIIRRSRHIGAPSAPPVG